MRISSTLLRFFFTSLVFIPSFFIVSAQSCPPNIDFETGTFNGWECYTGTAETVNGNNVINLNRSYGPVANRHVMYGASANAQLDPYGGFPVNCPNGSGHSIRLGNDLAGTQAEGISYEFTIPLDQDIYSLIYHYAVVFQDPNHEQFQQPRLVIEITNITDNKQIDCSSFTFFPYGSLLPGFFISPTPSGNAPVWCKDWSAVSINLDGNAGKKIRLFFKTADCTFRRHFGYAYVDVNSECSSDFVGSTYCSDDSAVNLTAPFGYESYHWYNTSFTKNLGDKQTIRFDPPPPPGAEYAVTVVPYNGYGCVDTLFATLENTLTVEAIAGKDTLSCNYNPVPIGTISKPGLVYTWTPAAGLSNPTASNPFASPGTSTLFIIKTNHDGGGCIDYDSVFVRASVIDSVIGVIGKNMYCSDSDDRSLLTVTPSNTIQWYRNDEQITGANQPVYDAVRTGSYYAMITNADGCTLATKIENIIIDDPIQGITYPVEYAVADQSFDLKARQIGDSVFWRPGIFLDTPVSYTPVFNGSADQLYTIRLATNSGCITIDTQLVKIAPKVEIYVPTAFTPNNDGVNDLLRPVLMGVKKLNYFKIYNRIGEPLFQTSTNRIGWDGVYKGEPQTSQVVVWIAEAEGTDNKIYVRKGSTMLIR